jgi:hypothetical protein
MSRRSGLDNIAGKLATCWSAIKSIPMMRCCLLSAREGTMPSRLGASLHHRGGELIRVMSAVKGASA